jgi:hypothetical protein
LRWTSSHLAQPRLGVLSCRRLLREIRALDYDGGYTAVTDFLRTDPVFKLALGRCRG